MGNISTYRVVFVAKLLYSSDFHCPDLEIGNDRRSLNGAVMYSIRRLHHPKSAVTDGIGYHVAQVSFGWIGRIPRHHPHVVPPAFSFVEAGVDRDLVNICPVNKILRFEEAEKIIPAVLLVVSAIGERAVVQDVAIAYLGNILLPDSIVLELLLVKHHSVIFPVHAILRRSQPRTAALGGAFLCH